MDEDVPEKTMFAKFEKQEQFLTLLHSLLSLDLDVDPPADTDRSEISLLRQLTEIVNGYQEQSYLLDPYLEQLVVPAVDKLKVHAKAFVANHSRPISLARLDRLAQLLYGYMTFRGYKTIIRFFPHEIADLSIVLEYLLIPDSPVQEQSQWTLRYIVLLWLSLICMIPFDLAQFDEDDQIGRTAEIIESVAKAYLGRSGLERESAALSLSRLYTRKDTSSKFVQFLEWSISTIGSSPDLFLAVGLLQVVSEITKSGPSELTQTHLHLTLEVARSVDRIDTLVRNSVVRKLKTKIIARAALRLLPAKVNFRRRKGRVIQPDDKDDDSVFGYGEIIAVPDEIETILEELFRALQDKDTVVRWSAAKGIARISERLPPDFVDQVLKTLMGLFDIHSIAVARIYDMPTIAESTWHGACLACAEMARRGLVSNDQMSTLVGWLSKAIYFDIRKGSHSIGSGVRDATSYVLWSLARVQDPSSLAPHSLNLARRLAAVSLFDREVHIRRAASAAYQEHVGRTGLFPDGIDILRKMDFYAVGVRRNSFLIAAPQVAEHDSYRLFLIDHLVDVTLRHWDPAMRVLGAQSLKAIAQLTLTVLGPLIAKRAAELLVSHDWNDTHGSLTTLAELAGAFQASDGLEMERQSVFKSLAGVPLSTIIAPRNDLVLSAACYLIANSISLGEIRLENGSSVPYWRQVIDSGLKHRSASVQGAAADALRAVSKLVDCSAVVESTLITECDDGVPSMQQSLGRVLGILDYDAHPSGIRRAVEYMLASVETSATTFIKNVEARRNFYESMPLMLTTASRQLGKHLTPTIVCQLIDALLIGLKDYTMDERGDVGSWIRVACIKGLGAFAEVLFRCTSDLSLNEYFPADKYHSAIAGILKQGVERLDNVRHQAGHQFMKLLSLPLPDVDGNERWMIHEGEMIRKLFSSDGKPIGWNEAGWLYPRAVNLLDISEYRESVFAGLVLSIGSKTDSTLRPASSSLVDYVHQLPVACPGYCSRDLVRDLVGKMKQNMSNNNLFLPLLQTLNVLLQADALEKLSDDDAALTSLKNVLSLVTSSVNRIKNIERAQESMKAVVGLLTFPSLFEICLNKLGVFLQHRYPKIRADTAEYLYLVLQSKDVGRDTDDAEDVLLETEWSSTVEEVVAEASKRLVDLLSRK